MSQKLKDRITTAIGVIGGAFLAADIDWNKLAAGDRMERNQAIGVLIVAIYGWFIGRPTVKGELQQAANKQQT